MLPSTLTATGGGQPPISAPCENSAVHQGHSGVSNHRSPVGIRVILVFGLAGLAKPRTPSPDVPPSNSGCQQTGPSMLVFTPELCALQMQPSSRSAVYGTCSGMCAANGPALCSPQWWGGRLSLCLGGISCTVHSYICRPCFLRGPKTKHSPSLGKPGTRWSGRVTVKTKKLRLRHPLGWLGCAFRPYKP